MKIVKLFFLLLSIAGLINSCTIEKRKYLDGYHVEWHNKPKSVQPATPSESTDAAQQDASNVVLPETESVAKTINNENISDEKISTNANNEEKKADKLLVENADVKSTRKKHTERPLQAQAAKQIKSIYENKISALLPDAANEDSEAGTVLAKIAFGLLILTVLIAIAASLIVEGWTALGYFIIAMLTFGLATLFAIIAKLVLDAKEQETPWYLWTTLIAALLIGLWILIKFIS
jgi:hypothetical protein